MENCWISTREARRIIGCDVQELRKLLKINAVKGIRKENNGWLVDKRSAEAFSEVLAEILTRKELERESWMEEDIEQEDLIQDEAVQEDTVKATSILDCDLNPRLWWLLRQNGIHTVDQLAEMSKSDLRDIYGIGSKSVKIIEKALLKFGHILREE